MRAGLGYKQVLGILFSCVHALATNMNIFLICISTQIVLLILNNQI